MARAEKDDVVKRKKDDVFVPRPGGDRRQKDDVVLRPQREEKSVPAWMNPASAAWASYNQQQNLPAAIANAQQWSAQTPAYDLSYFQQAAQQDAARRKAAVTEKTSSARDQQAPKRNPGPLGFRGQGGANAPVVRPPEWLARPPAYGGGYNPSTEPPAWLGGEANIPPPAVGWYGQNDPHHSMNPMIDYYPNVSGPLLPWWMQAAQNPTLTPAPTPSNPPAWNDGNGSGNGFGTNYGRNWRGGGGGGGGYGYGGGGGYDNYPAWMRSLMGLYSWNIK